MILLSLALLALPQAAAPAERRYAVTDFDRVLVEGPVAVELVTGRPSSAAAYGAQNALDRVTVDVQGTTLRVRPNRSAWGAAAQGRQAPVRVRLATRSLRSARVLGSGSLTLTGARALGLDLGVDGAGQLEASGLTVDTLSLSLSGNGRMDLAGTAAQVRARLQGSGAIDAEALRARGLQLYSDGSGRVAMTVHGPATVAASGLGKVDLSGRPSCTLTGPGAAQVRCASDQR